MICHDLRSTSNSYLGDLLIESVAYGRTRLILELEMNTGERYQSFAVPRRVAIGLVQADEPATYTWIDIYFPAMATLLRVLGSALIVLFVAAHASAQWAKPRDASAPRAPDGKPNL